MSFDFYDQGPRFEDIQRDMLRPGLTLAEVTNITDPDKLNRVLCKPVVSESEKDVLETEWCPVVQALSGKSCGQFYMPSVGDLVLLCYLNGDPHCPYVVGGVWNQNSPAPYTLEDGKNFYFSVKTPGGTELLFYDEKSKEYIKMNTPSGASLTIHDEEQKATLSDPEGKNCIVLSWKDGGIQITAEKTLTLSAGSTEIILKQSGEITVKADKSVTIQAADITEKASNGYAASGASAEVKATGKLTLSGASADLKGTTGVNIN